MEIRKITDRAKEKFLIGAYFFDESLYTDEDVQRAADMDIDFLVAVPADRVLLDLCEKYGLGVIASGNFQSWWGDNGQNAGGYAEAFPLSELEAAVEHYPFHPALWGDYPVDEPNVKDFRHLNAVIQRYEELLPGRIPFVNLYPNYATTEGSTDLGYSQLGTASYKEHIERYVQEVDNSYICIDCYPFPSPMRYYLENLDIVSAACRESRRDMWVIVQTGAWKAENILEEFQLRWQINLCLAYGTRLIMHACYFHGWWDPSTSCVNNEGEPNSTYEYAQKINRELHALGDTYLSFRHLGVYIAGDIGRAHECVRDQLKAQLERGCFSGFDTVSVTADGAVIVGCFERDDGKRALMLVNTANPYEKDAVVHAEVKCSGGKEYALRLDSGCGEFIVIDSFFA